MSVELLKKKEALFVYLYGALKMTHTTRAYNRITNYTNSNSVQLNLISNQLEIK